jgi:HlyD family secretion protein
MTRRRTYVAAAAAVALALAVTAALFLRFGRSVTLPVVEVARGQLVQRVTGPGTVQARAPVNLSSRITATLRQVDADVGDFVKRGQVLALLDSRELTERRGVVGGQQAALEHNQAAAQANVAKAQAELELARSKRERDAELLRTGFVSQAVLDASDAALRAASANLDNARAALAARESDAHALGHEARYAETQLSFTRIASPIDGVVIARHAEAGATLVPGSALFRIVDPAALWVATRVDESVVGRVQVGQSASIRLRTGDTVSGKVARIAHQSDAATRELEVDVAFDTPPKRFAIDQEAEVSIDTGSANGIVLPVAALARDALGRQGVWLVVDSRTEFRAVQTGASDGQRVLIVKGLSGGERIVARAEGVKAGVRVHATEPAAP